MKYNNILVPELIGYAHSFFSFGPERTIQFIVNAYILVNSRDWNAKTVMILLKKMHFILIRKKKKKKKKSTSLNP